MGLNFREIGKWGFLLVVIGFFMPVSCSMNGFQIAEYAAVEVSLALYGLFFSALVGLIIGILLIAKKAIPVLLDRIVALICVGSGFILLLETIKEGFELQSGGYVILLGCVTVLVLETLSEFQHKQALRDKQREEEEWV
jgi:hypothetical protein